MKKLFLIPVPLAGDGLQALTPQIKDVLLQTNYFFAENIRTARRFISSMKTGRVIEEMVFFELSKDTSEQQLQSYFKQIPPDALAGLMSEAGCPGVADPGAMAVAYAHKQHIQVVPLVGPSSLLLALMASGMNGQSFVFHGYLPIDKAARIKAIKNLEKESLQKKQTQLFIETPYRNNALLADLVQQLHPQTRLCIAVNLTAADEWISTRQIGQWQGNTPDLHKKPAVFLIQAE